MDPITIGLALARFAPTVIGWIAGDDAEEKAEKVVGIAEQITGKRGTEAVSALEKDPELAFKFQELVINQQSEELRATVENRNKTQDTMQTEVQNKDSFVRRARPALLWCIGISIILQILVGAFVILVAPAQMAAFVALCQAMSIPQGTAAAVCGVYMKKRSDDKLAAQGIPPKPLLGGLFK